MKKQSYHKQPKTSWDDAYNAIDAQFKPDQSKWKSAKSHEKTNPFQTPSGGNYLLDGIYQD